MSAQDPELSAALGWPGGISDPVLDRTLLLQMVAALRLASQQALEACEQRLPLKGQAAIIDELNNLRAALAQKEEPLNLSDPAVQKRLASQWGYVPAAAQAEPAQEPEGLDWRYTARIGYVVKPYTAPPQRTMVPLTEEEIDAEWHELDGEASALFKRVIRKFARAVEKASWEKNK